MKRLLTIAAGVALLSLTAVANATPFVTFSAPGVMHSSVAGTTEVTFEGPTGQGQCYYSACYGDYTVFSGSSSHSAAPAGDSTNFVSVPNPNSFGSAYFKLGKTANYFGLYWGSIDSYNTISFMMNGATIASYKGSDLVLPANGNQTSDSTNRYVNFFFGSQSYNTIKMTSTKYAFESDNHAFGTVPEPGTLALLGLGLVGLVLTKRRTRS